MATFEYTVHDAKGTITTGASEGENREDVASSLIDQGLTPISLNEKKKSNIFIRIKNFTIIPSGEKVLFAEELSTLVNAGVPIDQALTILEKQTSNKKLKETLSHLSRDVQGGLSLSSSLIKYPDVFSSIFVNMVRAGEISGTLDEALNDLAEQLAKDHELVAKIRGAMIYPAVILVAMIAAMIYMMLTIIPQLAVMFNDLGGKLPITTQSLIFISQALSKYGIITFSLIALIVLGYRYALKHYYFFRLFIHKIILRTPVFGKLTRKVNIARFARSLGSLLSSGVSVPESLSIVADSTKNLVYKEAIEKTAERVQNGSTIAENISNFPIFPVLVPQMIAVGEETGSLDTILKKVAVFYDREVNNITNNLTVLLEPMMMIIIGVMVGYMIISIIGPIYQMTNMI